MKVAELIEFLQANCDPELPIVVEMVRYGDLEQPEVTRVTTEVHVHHHSQLVVVLRAGR